MNNLSGLKTSFFSLALGYLLLFVGFIMQLVMNTAPDRQNYLAKFSAPFKGREIEIGFQYYMELFKLAGIPPDVGIVITCLIIFTVLARFWFAYVALNWLESVLIFNFFIFSLFQTYLGASIRMGLATSLALYASMRLMRGNVWFLLALWICPLLHYGTVPFALVVSWVWLTKNMSWRIHKLAITIACFGIFFLVGYLIQFLGLGAYYMQYFESNFGQTERLFPFVGLFFALAIIALCFEGEDSLPRRVVFYGLPFFSFGTLGGVGAPIFFKILLPNIFMAAMLVVVTYKKYYVKNITPELRLYLICIFNIVALLYALRQWEYI